MSRPNLSEIRGTLILHWRRGTEMMHSPGR
jgi:hypothetical protein